MEEQEKTPNEAGGYVPLAQRGSTGKEKGVDISRREQWERYFLAALGQSGNSVYLAVSMADEALEASRERWGEDNG